VCLHFSQPEDASVRRVELFTLLCTASALNAGCVGYTGLRRTLECSASRQIHYKLTEPEKGINASCVVCELLQLRISAGGNTKQRTLLCTRTPATNTVVQCVQQTL
jgi:hypothetical protein